MGYFAGVVLDFDACVHWRTSLVGNWDGWVCDYCRSLGVFWGLGRQGWTKIHVIAYLDLVYPVHRNRVAPFV
ncbi:hypothetical protein TorRG33x02_240550, partial [Trema orientale]